MLRALCLTMTVLLFSSSQASADTPPKTGDNAALKYWQAFATLPRFTEAEPKKLAESLTEPLDGRAAGIPVHAADGGGAGHGEDLVLDQLVNRMGGVDVDGGDSIP